MVRGAEYSGGRVPRVGDAIDSRKAGRIERWPVPETRIEAKEQQGDRAMKDFVGPILGFRGSSEETWNLCILLITRGPRPSVAEWVVRPTDDEEAGTTHRVEPERLGELDKLVAWIFELGVPMTEQHQTVDYSIAGESWSFEVPAQGAAPHMAYTSCNGFGQMSQMKEVEDPYACWRDLARCHEDAPFHLLLMGGDQLYADSLWELPEIRRWLGRSRRDETQAPRPAPTRLLSSLFAGRPGRWRRSFTKKMEEQVTHFFADLYRDRFGQPEVAALFARIPTVMMWDDHDIFDGWGSHPRRQHESPVYQGIFGVARQAFELFQLRTQTSHPLANRLPGSPAYNQLFDLGNVALLVLDLRTERTLEQVMSPESREAMVRALDKLEGCRHLLVMSSIPFVYLDLSVVERVLAGIPGQQALEDDLRDMWQSPRHHDERAEILVQLFELARAKGCRVTLVSGDVHLAAHGVIRSRRSEHLEPGEEAREISQLISSGIVNTPPPSILVYAYETLAPKHETLAEDIDGGLLPFAQRESHFLNARNWLEIRIADDSSVTATWHAEEAQKEDHETETRRAATRGSSAVGPRRRKAATRKPVARQPAAQPEQSFSIEIPAFRRGGGQPRR